MSVADDARRQAAGEARSPIAVLVEREGLGDSLLKLPLLRAIARGYPGRPIWWISSYQTAMSENLRPFTSDLIAEARPWARITAPLSDAAPKLRELPAFSHVFDTRTRIASVWLARRVLRYRRYYAALPGYVLSDARPPGRFARPRHVGERAFSLAQAALGKAADGDGRLESGEEGRKIAARLLPEGRTYIGLAVGSREARKNWPLEKFAELASLIAGRGLVPVLLTGPQEQAYAADIARLVIAAINAGPAIAPLDVAIAVAARLRLAVANDSGLGHLCGAAGTPVVSLFGPTDPRRWAPIAPAGRIISARDFGGEATPLIPVQAVAEAVDDMLLRTESCGRLTSPARKAWT